LDEHRFIVRVLRAQRIVWLLPLLLFSSRALREHGDRPSCPPIFSASCPLDIWNLPVNRIHPGIGKISVDVRKTPTSKKLSD